MLKDRKELPLEHDPPSRAPELIIGREVHWYLVPLHSLASVHQPPGSRLRVYQNIFQTMTLSKEQQMTSQIY